MFFVRDSEIWVAHFLCFLYLAKSNNTEERRIEMSLFRKLYFFLFAKVSDAIELLEKGECEEAKELLIKVQNECEDIYIDSDEDDEEDEEE